MKVNYQYASPSMCVGQGDHVTLGLSPDRSRDEQVSFSGRLKDPLLFRDAMLMLRQIVISDGSQKKKERVEFFEWLDTEIERRILEHQEYLPGVREDLQQNIEKLKAENIQKDKAIGDLVQLRQQLKKEIDHYDAWKDYYQLERKFWHFIKSRDLDLWYVLDPVITVHPDQVSFEAFSVDESIYGCLSIDMDQFDLLTEPNLGTTNIDFSAKLATEMERFRTYTNVELSVNPGGFTVDTGVTPEYLEKKIDLPETWIKGFNQVSSAANLGGTVLELEPVDLYDICSFLRRHKAHKSPRYMKWVLNKNRPIKIVFEPFGKELILKTIYRGEKNREEKIWGRRRWLVIEKLIPLAKSFQIKLLGFGMPQFITADLGGMKMTVGFSAWTANDWVKGTAFNIMNGFIGEGSYEQVYELLKEKRMMTLEQISSELSAYTKSENISGVGSLLKRGEGYFDGTADMIRFRRLCNSPIPEELYATTETELMVKELIDQGMEHFKIQVYENYDYEFSNYYQVKDKKDLMEALLTIDQDGQISKVSCGCREFQKGPRNISAPCAHILALYVVSAKFTRLNLECNREYRINDIMEVLI